MALMDPSIPYSCNGYGISSINITVMIPGRLGFRIDQIQIRNGIARPFHNQPNCECKFFKRNLPTICILGGNYSHLHRTVTACDLEEKLSLEMKMKEGTTRLLAACRHTDQTLAAVKSLLTSDIRLAAYRTELHRRAINRPTAETQESETVVSSDLNFSEIVQDLKRVRNPNIQVPI
ncbi:RTKN2 [Cordylochernes scorpioides]|uniref:RTKN2 n=1 Tax=Cordylochernes scorpioides TaxID=51811 RepID=A0ABY6KID8_9ARAC|nr:RTKN2 [Cordylochernes scorpioides]